MARLNLTGLPDLPGLSITLKFGGVQNMFWTPYFTSQPSSQVGATGLSLPTTPIAVVVKRWWANKRTFAHPTWLLGSQIRWSPKQVLDSRL